MAHQLVGEAEAESVKVAQRPLALHGKQSLPIPLKHRLNEGEKEGGHMRMHVGGVSGMRICRSKAGASSCIFLTKLSND